MAINLQKGQKINLEKENGQKLTKVCVGLNWGMIEKQRTSSGFLGLGAGKTETVKIDVDLDASCVLLNQRKEPLEVIYFGNLRSKIADILHSGDDLTGDSDGDDGLDNEIISVNLNGVPEVVDQIVFFLNSFKKQDFGDIPFAKIRLYEGTPTRVDKIHAVYDIANAPEFKGSIAMVMGKLYRRNGEWKFSAIGDPTGHEDLQQTVNTIIRRYA